MQDSVEYATEGVITGGERIILNRDDMFITVQVRNVYGNDLVYPADDKAILFAALIGAKTFSARHISAIKALGYAIHVASGKLPFEMQVTRF